jgi:hypothetical protein
MTEVYKYRVFCTTDNKYLYLWSDTEPTTCPENNTHTIDANETQIVRVAGDGSLKTIDDNRLVVAPSVMPDTYTVQFIGASDDYANGTRGMGTSLHITMADGAPSSQYIQLYTVDPCLALGASICSGYGNEDDYFEMTLMAPATPVTVNGTTTGNCNLYNVGPGNLILPAAGNGTHDVDLTAPMNANLAGPDPVFVSQAVPVPAEDLSGVTTAFNGYWDWTESTGQITVNSAQTGQYNLYDFAVPLTRWIKHFPVWAMPGVMFKHKFLIHNKGAKVLPQWYVQIETTRATSHDPSDPAIHYEFMFYLARKRTV